MDSVKRGREAGGTGLSPASVHGVVILRRRRPGRSGQEAAAAAALGRSARAPLHRALSSEDPEAHARTGVRGCVGAGTGGLGAGRTPDHDDKVVALLVRWLVASVGDATRRVASVADPMASDMRRCADFHS